MSPFEAAAASKANGASTAHSELEVLPAATLLVPSDILCFPSPPSAKGSSSPCNKQTLKRRLHKVDTKMFCVNLYKLIKNLKVVFVITNIFFQPLCYNLCLCAIFINKSGKTISILFVILSSMCILEL